VAGYDLHSRWPTLYGPDALRSWEQTGFREFEVSGKAAWSRVIGGVGP
jgi:hypothetical protein